MDESQQAVRLAVFRRILRNPGQDGFGVVAHHRKFQQVGRIEHHVGRFLERVNPFLLGRAHIGPLRDGLAGRKRTFLVIPHNPPQQAVIGSRNPVMII